jgi:hypothetical protein
LIVLAYFNSLWHLSAVYLENKPQRRDFLIDLEIESIDIVAGYCGEDYPMIPILFDPVLFALDNNRSSSSANVCSTTWPNPNIWRSPRIKNFSLLVQVDAFQIVQLTTFSDN